MSIDAPAIIRRVRWYHPPVAFAGSLLLPLVFAFAYLLVLVELGSASCRDRV